MPSSSLPSWIPIRISYTVSPATPRVSHSLPSSQTPMAFQVVNLILQLFCLKIFNVFPMQLNKIPTLTMTPFSLSLAYVSRPHPLTLVPDILSTLAYGHTKFIPVSEIMFLLFFLGKCFSPRFLHAPLPQTLMFYSNILFYFIYSN